MKYSWIQSIVEFILSIVLEWSFKEDFSAPFQIKSFLQKNLGKLYPFDQLFGPFIHLYLVEQVINLFIYHLPYLQRIDDLTIEAVQTVTLKMYW